MDERDIIEQLEDEAQQLSGSSIRNGCPDCGISAILATEAAKTIAFLRGLIVELEERAEEDDRSWNELTISAAKEA